MLEDDQLKLNKEDADIHWEVSNVSAGGYCLRWNSDTTSRAQIGELIGIREREPNGNFEWRIGVIRWMQFTRDTGLEIGVQVFSPKVIVASVQRHNRKNEEPFECLMIPGIRPLKQPPSVLVPAHAFKTGDKLNAAIFEHQMIIVLNDVGEHTGSFTQFGFTNADEASRSKQAEKKKSSSKKQNDFDEIWSSL